MVDVFVHRWWRMCRVGLGIHLDHMHNNVDVLDSLRTLCGAARTRQAAVCGTAVYILRFCAILHQLLSVKLFTIKSTTEYAVVELRAPRQMALLYQMPLIVTFARARLVGALVDERRRCCCGFTTASCRFKATIESQCVPYITLLSLAH